MTRSAFVCEMLAYSRAERRAAWLWIVFGVRAQGNPGRVAQELDFAVGMIFGASAALVDRHSHRGIRCGLVLVIQPGVGWS